MKSTSSHRITLVTLVSIICLSLVASWASVGYGRDVSPGQGEPAVVAKADVDADKAKSQVDDVKKEAEGEGQKAKDEDHGGHEKVVVTLWWALPFALLLLSIAVMPLVNAHFWHKNYPYISIALGSITAVYYLFFLKDASGSGTAAQHAWFHEMQEYVSFIALLASLYIVSGGIVIDVKHRGSPLVNTILLANGAIIANVVGTTGAAMLLIRPYIRINRDHIRPYHIVFFIFLVANCGGCLTPIGDPPLFMGYLKGVPFFWVLKACWPLWLMCCIILLIVFYVVDSKHSRNDDRKAPSRTADEQAISLTGHHNFLFIILILVGVFMKSMFKVGMSVELLWSREIMMAYAIIGSKLMTRREIYESNEFNYEPIREVALLFIGIFSTMVPALNWLQANSEQIPLKQPTQYYYVTGSLSAVLDNAPTYLVFLATKQGEIEKNHADALAVARTSVKAAATMDTGKPPTGLPEEAQMAVNELHKDHPDLFTKSSLEDSSYDEKLNHHMTISMLLGNPALAIYLIAISVGAVFFGACTYIGNGPNFMVKSIAESAGITMPSFFGYMLKYALPILVPIYILVWAAYLYVVVPMMSG